MARPRQGEPLVRQHLWLYQSDVDWLNENYGATLGISQIVRALVRRTRRELEARQGQGESLAKPADIGEFVP